LLGIFCLAKAGGRQQSPQRARPALSTQARRKRHATLRTRHFLIFRQALGHGRLTRLPLRCYERTCCSPIDYTIMDNLLDQPVLVLNRLWQAINTCSARRALTLLYQGHAQVVANDGSSNYFTHDFVSWRDFSVSQKKRSSSQGTMFLNGIRTPASTAANILTGAISISTMSCPVIVEVRLLGKMSSVPAFPAIRARETNSRTRRE